MRYKRISSEMKKKILDLFHAGGDNRDATIAAKLNIPWLTVSRITYVETVKMEIRMAKRMNSKK